jgi:hypothetical protein
MLKILQNFLKSCVIIVRTGLVLTMFVFMKIIDFTSNIFIGILNSFLKTILPKASLFKNLYLNKIVIDYYKPLFKLAFYFLKRRINNINNITNNHILPIFYFTIILFLFTYDYNYDNISLNIVPLIKKPKDIVDDLKNLAKDIAELALTSEKYDLLNIAKTIRKLSSNYDKNDKIKYLPLPTNNEMVKLDPEYLDNFNTNDYTLLIDDTSLTEENNIDNTIDSLNEYQNFDEILNLLNSITEDSLNISNVDDRNLDNYYNDNLDFDSLDNYVSLDEITDVKVTVLYKNKYKFMRLKIEGLNSIKEQNGYKENLKDLFNTFSKNLEYLSLSETKKVFIQGVNSMKTDETSPLHKSIFLTNKTTFEEYYDKVKDLIVECWGKGYGYYVSDYFEVWGYKIELISGMFGRLVKINKFVLKILGVTLHLKEIILKFYCI